MPPLLKKNWWGWGGKAPSRFGAEKHFYDVFDNTCDISDFRAHFFCPQTTQELPKKHNEAGPPEQLPTDEFSQIDYRRTRHREDCLCQRTTNAKGILENLCRGICMAEWKMSPPSFKTLRRLCNRWSKHV